MFDNPRGQLPGTGIRSDAENLYSGNLYEGSTQGVSGNSSGGVTVTEESLSGRRSLPVNVLGNGSGGASTSGQASAYAGEERPVCFQIQEIVFHFSIHLRRLWRHLVQQRGMNLSIWELMSF